MYHFNNRSKIQYEYEAVEIECLGQPEIISCEVLIKTDITHKMRNEKKDVIHICFDPNRKLPLNFLSIGLWTRLVSYKMD